MRRLEDAPAAIAMRLMPRDRDERTWAGGDGDYVIAGNPNVFASGANNVFERANGAIVQELVDRR